LRWVALRSKMPGNVRMLGPPALPGYGSFRKMT
jgi:hypothetical protein